MDGWDGMGMMEGARIIMFFCLLVFLGCGYAPKGREVETTVLLGEQEEYRKERKKERESYWGERGINGWDVESSDSRLDSNFKEQWRR